MLLAIFTATALNCVNTFKRLLILDNVRMTHVGKNSNLSPRFLPFFTWHLWKIMKRNVIQQELAAKHVKWWVEAYSRYANLLDDILAFSLFGFHKDGLSKWAFPNFLHLFVLVHVTGEPRSACWVYKWGAFVKTLKTKSNTKTPYFLFSHIKKNKNISIQ